MRILSTLGIVLVATSAVAQPAKLNQAQLLKVFHSEFVKITPGKGKFPRQFEMGLKGEKNAQPVHTVTFKYSFSIAKYEVPQNLYEAVMGNNPSRWKGPRNSVEKMTWSDCVAFCKKATQLLRRQKLIDNTQEIRLPSEAEWEYCCRAGTKTAYGFGDTAQKPGDSGKKASVLDAYGWHTGNAAGNDPPVGAKKPNAWGLYDMHGYLWEFVSDDWVATYERVPKDGRPYGAKKTDGSHPMRGGSWKDHFKDLRSGVRRQAAAKLADDAVGFRCVLAKVRAPKQ